MIGSKAMPPVDLLTFVQEGPISYAPIGRTSGRPGRWHETSPALDRSRATAYWDGLKASGTIESYEPVLLAPDGGGRRWRAARHGGLEPGSGRTPMSRA